MPTTTNPHTALIKLFEASVRQIKNAARAWQLVGTASPRSKPCIAGKVAKTAALYARPARTTYAWRARMLGSTPEQRYEMCALC